MVTSRLAMFVIQMTPRPDVFEYFTASRIGTVALVLTVTWILVTYTAKLLNALGEHGRRARFAVSWAAPILRISLWFVAGFISFAVLSPSRDAFLAAIGSVAIAIGLGAQDLVKNLIGGLVIIADRPYQLGDRVRIGDAYGEILHIGLRSTKLITPDNTKVTIPNSEILNAQVFNANSGVPDCMTVTSLILPPATDPELAIRIGYESAWTSPFTYAAKPVRVVLSDEIQDSAFMRLKIKAYVFDHRFETQMQSDITTRAKAEFLRLGVFAPK
jgi:small-conductance mechanosensitive channel